MELTRPNYLSRFKFYGHLTSTEPGLARHCWNELQNDNALFEHLLTLACGQPDIDPSQLGASIRSRYILGRLVTFNKFSPANAELYTLIRCSRPKVVVETGVASGVSTTLILQAIQRNGFGHLYSVDLPSRESKGYVNKEGIQDRVSIGRSKSPGWLVPDHLRAHWTLNLGDSLKILPGVLRGLPGVDFFYHDSDHSFAAMTFEFATAWESMRPGSLLYADDVGWNDAFLRFSETVKHVGEAWLTPLQRGLILRTGSGSKIQAARAH